MTEKKVYLFANWKMYLDCDESVALAQALARTAASFSVTAQIAVFPTTLALRSVAEILSTSHVAIGAQNAYWVEKGGYTGETSVAMLPQIGVSYVLVGHSERRHLFHETNKDVQQKLEAAVAAGVTPVLCVGETQAERDLGTATEAIEAQLRAALGNVRWPLGKELYVAYEPVWAVGTGNACGVAEAEQERVLLKKIVNGLLPNVTVHILYGGSVRPENVAGYIGVAGFDGVLVGQASTQLKVWLDIIAQATDAATNI